MVRLMSLWDVIERLSLLDIVALALALGAWLGVRWLIEHPPGARQSVTTLMADLRRRWLREMAKRDTRIFDAQIVGSLRQGTSFFASATILAVGAVLSVLGNAEMLGHITQGLMADGGPVQVTQLKLLLVVFFLVEGFLRFAWANRIFGYASVAMAAVPAPDDPEVRRVARQSAELNIRAAINFNRGLRAIYFGLAAFAWIGGAIPLLLATTVAVVTLLRREFSSSAHAILTQMEGEE